MTSSLIVSNKKTIKSLFAFGTDIHFIFYQQDFEELYEKVFRLILDMEDKLSVFKPKSLVSKLNKFGNYIPIKVSPEIYELIKNSVEYSIFTDGYFDISAKRIIDLWRNARQNNKLPTEEEIETAVQATGRDKIILLPNNRIKLKNNARLDFGAIAKGFLADKIKTMFEEEKVKSAIVDLCGHILTVGKKSDGGLWKVGIRHPLKTPNDIICYLEVESTSVVTSASYERYFMIEGKKFSHIINPKTGYPAKDDILSVTVVSSNSSFADALSTALFAMGFKKAINFIQSNKFIEAIVITPFKEIYATPYLAQKMVLHDGSFRIIKTNEVIVL